MLHLIARGGLCNRMRAMDSLYVLARKLKRPVRVLWVKNVLLGSWYEELFLPLADVEVISTPWSKGCCRWLRSLQSQYPPMSICGRALGFLDRVESSSEAKWNSLRRLLAHHGCHPHYDLYYVDYKHGTPQAPLSKERLSESQNPLLNLCSRLYGLRSPTAKHFVPIPALQARISERIRSFDAHVVGVHIRRTDSALSIRHSPMSAFEKAMQAELKKNPQTRFYVATDDLQEKKYLQKRFAHQIITSEGMLHRHRYEGVYEAVVELYALAHTRKIIGSYHSSFSEEAAWIGQKPLQIAREN